VVFNDLESETLRYRVKTAMHTVDIFTYTAW